MAYPNDPANPGGLRPTGFEHARITMEEAERLAAAFHPSWEVDQGSFVPLAAAPVALDEARRTPRSGGTAADVRGVVAALNGTHAPAPSAILQLPSRAAGGSSSLADPVRPREARAGRGAASSLERTGSHDFASIAKGPQVGVWVGLAGAAAVLVGVGLWLASSSGEKRVVPAAPADTWQQAEATSRIPPPPPPSEPVAPTVTAAATAAATVQAEPPRVAAPAAATVVAPLAPLPAPVPRATAAASKQATSSPKASRSKSPAQTIVRDVPF